MPTPNRPATAVPVVAPVAGRFVVGGLRAPNPIDAGVRLGKQLSALVRCLP
jgi:hypothetical protein